MGEGSDQQGGFSLKGFFAEKKLFWETSLPAILEKTSFNRASKGLQEALLYSLQAGGKRVRPLNVLESSRLAGLDQEKALFASTAVEAIHTYSLIHDDLPAMDDDDFRRGAPTSHKKFGEANAILAGDGLQALAFELLSLTGTGGGAFAYFASSVGVDGLVDGQYIDINSDSVSSEVELQVMHNKKTGRLMACSVALPFYIAYCGISGNHLSPEQKERVAMIDRWGLDLGLLFQIVDDILDVTQTSETLGKSAGKDLSQDKKTYITILGLEKSKKKGEELSARLRDQANTLFPGSDYYSSLPDYILNRSS